MAKTRAQRKAERRAREAEERKRSGGHESADSRLSTTRRSRSPATRRWSRRASAAWPPAPPRRQLRLPEDPKPSRGDKRAEARPRRKPKSASATSRSGASASSSTKKQKQAKAERQRSGFIGFLISCWQELKKVQWPDRETLIQATAVTILFVAVAAAYLGALDAAFSWLIKQIL